MIERHALNAAISPRSNASQALVLASIMADEPRNEIIASATLVMLA
jgi:hypothetical protein